MVPQWLTQQQFGHFLIKVSGFLCAFFLTLTSAQAHSLATNDIPQPSDNSALKHLHLQLNWHHQYEFAGFYAAIMQGYYRDAGLDVHLHEFDGSLNPVSELVSGKVDFTVLYSTAVADYIKGAPIQLVLASFQHSPMALIAHEPINSLSDLSGKKGMFLESLPVMSLLKKASKEIKEPVQHVNVKTNLQDFIDKKVDFYSAYLTNEPFQLQELGVSYYVIDPKLYAINSAEDFVVTTQAFANANPAMVAAFREATIKGWEFALAHPEAVIEFMQANYNVPKSYRALLYEAKALRSYVSVGSRPIGVVEPTRLKDTAMELKEIGMITRAQFDQFEPEGFLGVTKPFAISIDEQLLLELSGYTLLVLSILFGLMLIYRYQRNRFEHYIHQINELNYASKIDLASEKIVWVSQSYAQLRACDANQMIGQSFLEFARRSLDNPEIERIKQQLRQKQAWVGEVEGRTCLGESYWVKLTLTPQTNWLGKVTHVWATRVDITDKKRIEQLLNTDELTQLYNRHYFNKMLPVLREQHLGSSRHFCLASIDIDYFKLINDTYGHFVGDLVLKQVADTLKACCASHDTLAFRLGGEEFMLVAFVQDVDGFYRQLDQLRIAVLEANIENKNAPLGKLSISIGACCWPDGQQTDDWEALYRQVDDLLYQAKQAGRNQLMLAH